MIQILILFNILDFDIESEIRIVFSNLMFNTNNLSFFFLKKTFYIGECLSLHHDK
jgi:hypothetical protein